jgi:hypothetical protein
MKIKEQIVSIFEKQDIRAFNFETKKDGFGETIFSVNLHVNDLYVSSRNTLKTIKTQLEALGLKVGNVKGNVYIMKKA